jgi:hypothetical protein
MPKCSRATSEQAASRARKGTGHASSPAWRQTKAGEGKIASRAPGRIVFREQNTRRIVGEGIRLGRFRLDASGRQIEKWLHQDHFYPLNHE